MLKEHRKTKTMAEHTRGAIFLRQTTSFQGSCKFMCIRTGRLITRNQFKEVTIPSSDIRAVEALDTQYKQTGVMVFTDWLGNDILDTSNVDQTMGGTAGVDDNPNATHQDEDDNAMGEYFNDAHE
jgi:hypothetical protein